MRKPIKFKVNFYKSEAFSTDPTNIGTIEKVTTEKNFAARPLLKLYNPVNLPNFRQSPSFIADILRVLST